MRIRRRTFFAMSYSNCFCLIWQSIIVCVWHEHHVFIFSYCFFFYAHMQYTYFAYIFHTFWKVTAQLSRGRALPPLWKWAVFNHTLHDRLQSVPSEKKRKWPQHLPHMFFAYNTTVHSSTGHSPYELMFGQEPYLPTDSLLGVSEEDVPKETLDDWMRVHQARLRSTYRSAQQHLEKAVTQRIHHQPVRTHS